MNEGLRVLGQAEAAVTDTGIQEMQAHPRIKPYASRHILHVRSCRVT